MGDDNNRSHYSVCSDWLYYNKSLVCTSTYYSINPTHIVVDILVFIYGTAIIGLFRVWSTRHCMLYLPHELGVQIIMTRHVKELLNGYYWN